MRTLAIAFLLSFAAACGEDKKPAEPPPQTTEPAPAPANPTVERVKKDVERAGQEHEKKIDQALEVE